MCLKIKLLTPRHLMAINLHPVCISIFSNEEMETCVNFIHTTFFLFEKNRDVDRVKIYCYQGSNSMQQKDEVDQTRSLVDQSTTAGWDTA